MAELETGAWTAGQTRAQFGAIAWLRWRITVNNLRRKGGASELVGRVFLGMMFLGVLLAFVMGAGIGAFFLVHKGHLTWTAWLLWAIFILCQLLNIQLGQPATTFDPTQLIRFPLRVDTYVAIRLFFGLLTPANVAVMLSSVAVAVGIGVAAPGLWLYALIAMAVFAATNVLFSRMIFAWVDRWLSTRRAREMFTAVILAGSLGIQWANFRFNPAYNHNHQTHAYDVSQQHLGWMMHLFQRAQPWLAWMPPELASTSLVKATHAAVIGFAGYTLAAALYGALFLLVFALRMRKEFRGENLSDAVSGAARKKAKAKGARLVTRTASAAAVAPMAEPVVGEFEVASRARISGLVAAVLKKEILYVQRNMGVLYGLIMPVFIVLIFAGKFSMGRSGALWVFPAAVAYTLLAICPLSYNVFGLEATGTQMYFLAPVRMRDILLAKNVLGFLMALVEVALILVIITYMAGPPPLYITVSALLWATGTLAVNMIFGNQRSLASPKWVNPQRAMRRSASQVSALMSMVLLMVSSAVAAGVFGLCFWLHAMWALVPVFAVFAAAGVAVYVQSLKWMDKYAMEHRESLLLELSKAG
ncbi:MAG: hypothetical protein WB439_07280 [Acidobacteriaceae bacterium]